MGGRLVSGKIVPTPSPDLALLPPSVLDSWTSEMFVDFECRSDSTSYFSIRGFDLLESQ